MRIVEYEKDTTSLTYRVLKGLGIVAGLFSAIVCVLMIANHLSLKHTDPVHSPALERLIEQLKANPQDAALREQIRELDYLSRRAFFTSQSFTQRAIYVLLGGLVVMVLAFKSLEAYRQRFPYPNSKDPKDDLVGAAKWARQSVTVVGLVLVGFALVIALPWKSPLNDLPATKERATPGAAQSADAKPTVQPASADAKSPAKPATTPAPTAPVPVVSREEMLKNWPAFLGAAGGVAQSANLPLAWDATSGQGIVWKTEVPKPGFSSPVIWKNRLFLSGADKQAREVYCFDTEKGGLLWRHEVSQVPGSPTELPDVTSDTGYAASTMATDGARVFAIFATGDVVALDFEGRRIWARNLGVPDNPYGHGSSLAVFEDLLLVQFDHKGDGAFFGLDVKTGEPRWRTARKLGASWASPRLIEAGGKPEVVLAADPVVVSYDPRTGKELWRVACLKDGEVAPSPVFANGLLYAAAEHIGLTAINVSTRAIVWKQEEDLPGVSTPVVAGEFLIYGLGDGGIICRDAKTGKLLWREDTDEGYYASPVVAGDRVYLMDRTGVMHIVAAGNQFKSLGKPALGEEAFCTPAVIGNSIFYRAKKHLFRIGS